MALELTLHGLLPPSAPTLPLAASVYETTLSHPAGAVRVLRAVNGPFRYEWQCGGDPSPGYERWRLDPNQDEVSVPGGMWVGGFVAVLAAIERAYDGDISWHELEQLGIRREAR